MTYENTGKDGFLVQCLQNNANQCMLFHHIVVIHGHKCIEKIVPLFKNLFQISNLNLLDQPVYLAIVMVF